MTKAKTHYEQVPLHIVKKILEDETLDGGAIVKPRSAKVIKFKPSTILPVAGAKVGGRS